MKDLLKSADATKSDQKMIKRQVTAIIGFYLGFSTTALGVLSLICAWVFDVCNYCGGSGCWECDYVYVTWRGMPTISPWFGILLLAGGIITFIVVGRFKKKHNISDRSGESPVGGLVAVSLILCFIEIFMSSNSFKVAYNGLWSFAVGNMDYYSAILAAVYWLLVLIIPVCMTVSAVRGSIERAENEATWRKRNEDTISAVYKKVFSTVDCSTDEQTERLRNYVKDAEHNAIEEYRRQNNITITENTYSNLGICGISNAHFHYCLDEESSYHSYTDAVRIKENGYPLSAKKIPLNCIKCYKVEGILQYTPDVQGGGVNLQGAAIGALIGGDAAAIIGSRVGTETRTTIVEHDDRKLTIFYEDNGLLKTLQVVSHEFDKTVAALRKLIPQKEEAMVILDSSKNNAASNKIIVDEIKGLKELLDIGIITQEEFDAKKKQILGL